jgi:fucose 4-O-acetylase-like acetyltransferase
MRNIHLDNAKAALIVLVIFGHCIEPARQSSGILQALYLFLYAFHMPALAMVSGVFSPRDYSREMVGKSFRALIIPFLAFELLYEGAHVITTGQFSHYAQHMEPYWLLWFLPSLFMWRIALPAFLRLRFPLVSAILISFLVGASMTDGYYLDILRTAVFFPFFLVGAMYRGRFMSFQDSRRWRAVAVACLVLGLYLAFLYRGLALGWVYGAASFSELQVSIVRGIAMRSLLYMASAALAVAFLLVMPRSETRLGSLAPLMIYAYLWHGFVMKVLEKSGIVTMIAEIDLALVIALSAMFSLATFFLLTSRVVKLVTDLFLLKPLGALLPRLARP